MHPNRLPCSCWFGSPLAAWVKANIQYSIVLEKVAPLEQDLAQLNQGLEEANTRLHACQSELAELDQKVAEMKAEFGKRERERERERRDAGAPRPYFPPY